MTCAYHVNPEHRLVLFRPSGRFTESDFISLSRAAWSDPARKPPFAHVWDTHAIDELVMNASVIPMYRDFLNEHKEQITTGKVAIVTDRSVTRTFASMLIQVGHQHRGTFQLFDDMETAADWVSLPVDVLTNIPDARWTEP